VLTRDGGTHDVLFVILRIGSWARFFSCRLKNCRYDYKDVVGN